MKKKSLLDSFALLTYLNKEDGFEKVRRLLADAQSSRQSVLMNELNVGETYWIIHRKCGREQAEYFLGPVLKGLPISVISNNFDAVISAAKIKARYALSFADCFAVATAQRESAVVLTGDPEFKNVAELVEIEWLVWRGEGEKMRGWGSGRSALCAMPNAHRPQPAPQNFTKHI